MKTIKQIATETGKSKQAVWKKIDNLGLRSGLTKTDNRLTVNEQQEALIIQAFFGAEHSTVNRQSTVNQRAVDRLVDSLQEQLKAKDLQIAGQQQTIKELTAANRELTAALEHTTASLHAAQALHAGTMQKQLADGSGAEAGQAKTNWIIRLFQKRSK